MPIIDNFNGLTLHYIDKTHTLERTWPITQRELALIFTDIIEYASAPEGNPDFYNQLKNALAKLGVNEASYLADLSEYAQEHYDKTKKDTW
jgi:hypothetical protein